MHAHAYRACTYTTVLRLDFVWDYLGERVPLELFVCLTVFLHNSVQVFFGLPLSLASSTSHTRHTTILRLCGICLGHPGWAGTRRNITHSHSSWSPIIPICFLHLLRSIASSVFNPRALQSFSTISLQVLFRLPLGLVPFTSYSIHFFTQSLSSFRSTCSYHCNVFRCSTEIMSSNSSLPLNSLLGTLSCNFTPHIHHTILISSLWSATSLADRTIGRAIGTVSRLSVVCL